MGSLRSWLHNITLRDPLEQRQAPLLQIVLLGLATVLVLYLPVHITQLDGTAESFVSLGLVFTVLPTSLGAIWLIRRDRFATGVLLVVTMLIAVGAGVGLIDGVPFSGKTQLTFIMPLCLAGLLIGRRSIIAVLVLSVVAGIWIQLAVPDSILSARGMTTQDLLTELIVFIFISIMIGLMLDQFGGSLRRALSALLEREQQLEHAQSRLEQLVSTEQQTRAEAQRLQQSESEGRQRLEQAVGDYLDFVQAVADGQLERRLDVQDQDALGLLGAGLNRMAASLAQAQSEAHQLRQQELDDRARLEQAVDTYLAFVQQVAQGNLGQRMQVHDQGALGSLGAGLNSMADSLQRLTMQIQQAAANIAAAAAEIVAASTQQSASAAEQSAAITQTTTTIEEVKAIAQQTAAQATQLAGNNETALMVARQGIQTVEQTVGGMEQVKTHVEEIAHTILSLAERAQAIDGIVTTVAELADQSNLLALNAAIEAARAGEQGRSFAIVAQHVRDLAERSKLATAQVRAILSEIQQATHTAVLVTEEGTKGAVVGVGLAGQAGAVIHRIAGEVENSTQSNVQMAAAAQQQTTGMEQIGQAMLSIQQATTQTLASTRQAERTAQDLNVLARSLQGVVSTYQV